MEPCDTFIDQHSDGLFQAALELVPIRFCIFGINHKLVSDMQQ